MSTLELSLNVVIDIVIEVEIASNLTIEIEIEIGNCFEFDILTLKWEIASNLTG
jgi:hypothetical protein